MIRRCQATLALTALLAVLLASCAGDKPRDDEVADGPSTVDLKPGDVTDAVPRAEPRARYGNHSPYEVFGKTYHVLPSSDGYHEQGTASWYGSKFHGRRTSSGEPYDMHLATAAHRSLPLPTYAEITNLGNGKKVVVKINDRGPFKDDRLIDLSYGAALRLDMVGAGTARVDLRVIDPADYSRRTDSGVTIAAAPAPAARTTDPAAASLAAADADVTWLQAGAYGRREGAEELAAQLERAALEPVSIHDVDSLFRVWLGPYASQLEVESVIRRAIELGFERPHRVRR